MFLHSLRVGSSKSRFKTREKGFEGRSPRRRTTVNLAQAFTLRLPVDQRVLVVDFDPQANTTQASGIYLENTSRSIADLIKNRLLADDAVTYRSESFDLIPATNVLAQVEREMVGMTNSELRLAYRLRRLKNRYAMILIDRPPTCGPLLNSVLNAADYVIIPVDSGIFALHGIKSLLGEFEEIKTGTNPHLKVLGFLLTMADSTNICDEVLGSLGEHFGEQVLKTKIRRSVKLKEAPAFGKTIFHHAPTSTDIVFYKVGKIKPRYGLDASAIIKTWVSD